ncbi:MAG: lactate racemase domain-containing protein [Treponema sp.]|nr:lactate racemase domain-containing protein [Treponema sp.]
MTFISVGSPRHDIGAEDIKKYVKEALSLALEEIVGSGISDAGKVLILPPDGTRFHSKAGYLTDVIAEQLAAQDRLGAIMPAVGTHMAMSKAEIQRMFPKSPHDTFLTHDWRNDVIELGRIDADWVHAISGGAVDYDCPMQVNRILRDGDFSMIVSIGQVVPHEIMGMANHLKNVFIGTGGKELIDKSHYLGAVYGMERIMGHIDTPVRDVLDEGYLRFGYEIPPVLWVLTVVGPRTLDEERHTGHPAGSLALRGLFIGFGRNCYEQAAALAQQVNMTILKDPIKKAIVYLDPSEYRTTWLGNKSIYRTRMAMADGGELIVLAPGLEKFGEDPELDALIRRYGYRPGAEIREIVNREPDLADSLSVAAHLIHGSSEGRFSVRYCPGPKMSREEIESVGYEWGDLDEMMKLYSPEKMQSGWNNIKGEHVFYISNPALGLWANENRFYQYEL